MDATLDLDAYLNRIGISARPAPTLDSLRDIVAAHVAAIPYENIDVLLGRPPKLDLASLQEKMIGGGRGGYCFEQNILLRAALRALGFAATGLLARVVRGFPADAQRQAGHMAIRVDLPDGAVVVDVGFGNLTPTCPLVLRPDIEQATPHETMRFRDVGGELVLQARLAETWENLWRLCAQRVLDIDYDVSNWFVATFPASPFVNNLIAARPGADGVRHTFLNGRVNRRAADGTVARRDLSDVNEIAEVLAEIFGLAVPREKIAAAMEVLARAGRLGAAHPVFG